MPVADSRFDTVRRAGRRAERTARRYREELQHARETIDRLADELEDAIDAGDPAQQRSVLSALDALADRIAGVLLGWGGR